jgi:UDP-3-O-[3-hydroxymyristoyl] glucosamine N-acyltransferase
MDHTITEIAAALEARVLGDGSVRVSGVAEPAEAGAGDLALALKPEYAEGLKTGAARAAVVWDGADWQALGLEAAIVVPRPRYAMSGVTRLFDPGPEIAAGIHPSAVIDPSALIGAGAAIGPFAVIGRDVEIGARARIASHVSIGPETSIGEDALIHEGVRIAHRVTIGKRFIANPNAVIGGDGFAFVTPEKSNVEETRGSLGGSDARRAQSWTRIHSLGTVEIGDDVEIGCNATIDRGTIRATRVGRGTKIDNLVQIGHNCEIGEDCLFCSMVGISGSVRVGNRVVLAGKVGVSDNIFIGDDVVAGGAAKIFTNVPAGRAVLGHPAIRMDAQIEANKNIRRLSRLYRDVRELQKSVLKTGKTD